MLTPHLKAGLKKMFGALFSFLQFSGKTVATIIYVIAATIFGFVFRMAASAFGFLGHWLANRFKQPLLEAFCFVITPFAHAIGALAHAHIKLKKSKGLGVKHTANTIGELGWNFILGLGRFLRKAFNYAAPAACVAFFVALIGHASGLQYTISVEYNGNDLGVISNEAEYSKAQAIVQEKITYTDNDTAIIEAPIFNVRMMRTDDVPVDTDSLSELMMNSSEVGVVDAYGLYINDSLVGVYNEEEVAKIQAALDARLAENYDPEAIVTEFEDKIDFVEGRYLETNLVSADFAVEYILGSTDVEAYYVVLSGDSVSLIADKLGYTTDALIAENSFLADGVHAGDIVTYHYKEANLPVLTTHYESYDQTIDTSVQYIYDNDVDEYCEILKQRGSDGYENVTALVTEKDGRESDRTIVSRYVIEEMVPRIYVVGTQPNSFIEEEGNDVIDYLGTCVWPVGGDGGYISSLYGYRSWDDSNHKGIDIAADRGTEIYAAADGVVSFAGTYSSYGKLVIIDHGNGYETYYAHQSSILVEDGDVVKKGDIIGEVGMTGSASGNHLHFELRRYDSRMNPFLCLGGAGDHAVWE